MSFNPIPLRRKLNVLLALLLVSSPVFSQEETLASLLADGRYSDATRVARAIKPNVVIAQLKPLAVSTNAPAQWLLADAYWRAGEKEKAVHWGYSAMVATHLDASACRHSELVAPWMMQSYESIFREARRRPDLQAYAIKSAILQYSTSTALPQDREWACRIGAYLEGDKSRQATKAVADDTNRRRRKQELENLAKKAKITIETK